MKALMLQNELFRIKLFLRSFNSSFLWRAVILISKMLLKYFIPNPFLLNIPLTLVRREERFLVTSLSHSLSVNIEWSILGKSLLGRNKKRCPTHTRAAARLKGTQCFGTVSVLLVLFSDHTPTYYYLYLFYNLLYCRLKLLQYLFQCPFRWFSGQHTSNEYVRSGFDYRPRTIISCVDPAS